MVDAIILLSKGCKIEPTVVDSDLHPIWWYFVLYIDLYKFEIIFRIPLL